jgi:acetylornithine deacetylase
MREDGVTTVEKGNGKEEKVLTWLDGHADELTGLLQQLVRIPSVYPNEEPAQVFVREVMDQICDQVDIWEPDARELAAHPAYFAGADSFRGRPNVVGLLKGRGQGQSLLLNAHIDVVPPQPEPEWPHGAWSGAFVDGKIFGRGSLDDKSGVAIMLIVARAMRETEVSLQGDLQLHSVVDEEWGGAGTLAAMLRGHRADAGVVLEPCGPEIYPASRGGAAFRVRVTGRGAHPGASWKGVSALEKALPLIQGLKVFETERQERLRSRLFADYPIFAPVVVGRISADNIPSKVPEECVFEGLYGYTPQETWPQARSAFEERIAELASRDTWLKKHPPVISWPGLNKESAEISVDHPLVSCFVESARDSRGTVPRVVGFPAGCDLPLLVRYGPVPSLLFGAEGEWGVAHSSQEYVAADKLLDAARVVALAVMRWCGTR